MHPLLYRYLCSNYLNLLTFLLLPLLLYFLNPVQTPPPPDPLRANPSLTDIVVAISWPAELARQFGHIVAGGSDEDDALEVPHDVVGQVAVQPLEQVHLLLEHLRLGEHDADDAGLRGQRGGGG